MVLILSCSNRPGAVQRPGGGQSASERYFRVLRTRQRLRLFAAPRPTLGEEAADRENSEVDVYRDPVLNALVYDSWLPTKNIDAFTEWRAAFKKLKDFGLKSISAKDASDLVKSNEAIILDVRTGAFYDKEHAKGSANVPYFEKVKGSKGVVGKRLFLGPNTTEKNADFVKDVQALLGSNSNAKNIIVCCSTGGTLKNTITKRDGSSLVDSQRAFGLESLSLRAAGDLIEAGFKNILHLEGGFPAWTSEYLPTEGSSIKEVRAAGKEEKKVEKADPNAWANVHKALTDFGLKSISAKEASALASSKEAVIMDVRAGAVYEKEHSNPSVSVPYFDRVKGSREGQKVQETGKQFILGSNTTEKNVNFVKDAQAVLGSNAKDKTIVVYCSTGGTIKNDITKRDGSVQTDSQRPFGSESLSLRAANELIKAGYTNILHLDGGFPAWNAEGLPAVRSFDPDAWPSVHKALTGFGLKSVSAEEASNLTGKDKAVIIDVRAGTVYEKSHPETSLSVPYFEKVKGSKGVVGKRLFLGPNTTEKNADFVKDVQAVLGSNAKTAKTVIVCCSTGGTIKNAITKRNGDTRRDSQRPFGSESLSLRAANELIEAGYTNILHLEGGIPAWNAEGLPNAGSAVKEQSKKARKADPDAWSTVFKELTDAGLRSVSAKEASDLVGGSNAVMLDARTGDMHAKKCTDMSLNVSYLEKSKPGKRLFFKRKKSAKNASFLEEAEAALGSNAKGKTIIVYCTSGGTISRRPGLDSVSLRAANELIKAGYTNVLHLEGGVSAWEAEGLPTKASELGNKERREADPNAWANVHKALTDFGLKSISAKEASALASSKEAVIMDVRAGAVYQKEHSNPSVSVPYFDRVKGSREGQKVQETGKQFILGSNTTEKNVNFVKDAQAVLGSNAKDKTIVVYCSTGGTIKNDITKRDGSVQKDSQRPFGSESLSLRAANELIKAGYTNILHLDGGFPAWNAEGLPTKASEKSNKERTEIDLDPNAWSNVHASLVAAGIDSLDAADASKLANSGQAVIVDVGTVKKYEDEHVQGSINVPFLRKIETKGMKAAGKVAGGFKSSLGSSDDALERNPDFLEAFKRDVGDRKVIVACLLGGTLSTEVVSNRGKVFKDPQLKYGRESVSLRVISELLGAGYKNISHLDGGILSWKGQRLPMNGSILNQIIEEGPAGWRVDVLSDDQDKDTWRRATVTSYNEASGMFKVKYDDLGEDGNEVEVSLDQNRTKWLSREEKK